MALKELKSPFRWCDRHITIQDRIWYVPGQYKNFDQFTFPGWSHPHLFGNDQPIFLEYCSGNGAWIAARAKQSPTTNWIGVEMKFERVRKIWKKIKNLELNNLVAICGEGHTVTSHYFPAESVDGVFINFPDPWPKRRHTKNRIIQSNFVSELWRIMKKGSALEFVTDDVDYGNWTLNIMQKHSAFKCVYDAPHYIIDHEGYGNSYFEDLWREQGKTIRYYRFRKDCDAICSP